MKHLFLSISLCLLCAICSAQSSILDSLPGIRLEFVSGVGQYDRNVIEYDRTMDAYIYNVSFYEYNDCGKCISPQSCDGKGYTSTRFVFVFRNKGELKRFIDDMAHLIEHESDAFYDVAIGRYIGKDFVSYGNVDVYAFYQKTMGCPYLNFAILNKAMQSDDLVDSRGCKLYSTKVFHFKYPRKLIEQIDAFDPVLNEI